MAAAMRILYIDVDSLRADHLGCYGYHRPTSPTIDALAAEGVRFERVYLSDAPCAPSRTALFSGRLGIHTGGVTHGTSVGRPRPDLMEMTNPESLPRSDWMAQRRGLGHRAATVSPFASVCGPGRGAKGRIVEPQHG